MKGPGGTGWAWHDAMSAISEPRGWVRHLRATGQRDRLPWFQGFIRDED